MRKCFVIMSFDKNHERIYTNAIREAAREKSYECMRADSEIGADDVTDSIIRSIIEADVVIADLTYPKPNVYFELGIALSTCRPTICIAQRTAELPFDVRNYRVIMYEDDHLTTLKLELQNALEQISAYNTNPVMTSGKEYFDLRAKIESNLARIIEESKRAEEFAEFAKTKFSDNTSVADRLLDNMSRHIWPGRPNTVIAISGAGSIGKSTFSALLKKQLSKRFPKRVIEILPTDAYMMDRAERAAKNITGFDIRSHDLKSFERAVTALVSGRDIRLKPYDHSTGRHANEVLLRTPDVLILEGIHSHHPPLTHFIHHSVFIYATKFIVKELKFLADFMFRRYTPETAFEHSEREYMDYEEHVLPYYRQADDVISVEGYWRYRLEDAEGEYIEKSQQVIQSRN